MTNIFWGITLLVFSLISSNKEESKWVELFNGKNLSGWKAGENTGSFRVENGLLICSGERGTCFPRQGNHTKTLN